MSGLAGMFDLTDEKQAQEYLDTIGMEYRFQCYKEKLPDGCHRLADYLEAFKKDAEKAQKVYMKNCEENNYGMSCFKLGNYSILGRGGMEKNMEAALKYYEKGCIDGSLASCHNAGLLYHTGKIGGEPNYAKSSEYMQKGCDGGDAGSCQMLSAYFIEGANGMTKDMNKASKYADKACGMGHVLACVNLSIMYNKGEGVKKDTELSDKYKQKALDLHKDQSTFQQGVEFGK